MKQPMGGARGFALWIFNALTSRERVSPALRIYTPQWGIYGTVLKSYIS
jgi:hypothetical protein